MKKSGLITTAIVVITILIAIPIAIKVANNKKAPKVTENKTNVDSNLVKNIDNLVVSSKEMPDYTLEISGLYETTLNLKEIVDFVPLYEFDAGIVDIYGTHVNKYVGISYADLIKYLNVPHNTITVFKTDRKKVSYRATEIDYEKTFIVFYMDDKPINGSKMTLLAVNYNYLYSIEDLTSIEYQG